MYSDAALTGHQYCSQVSAVLKRTHDYKYFNYTTAKAVCHGQGGTLLTPAAYDSNCTKEILPGNGEYQAWIGTIPFRSRGWKALTTQKGAARYPNSSVDTPLYVVCEFRKLSTVSKWSRMLNAASLHLNSLQTTSMEHCTTHKSIRRIISMFPSS